jgi:hypothetical protein
VCIAEGAQLRDPSLATRIDNGQFSYWPLSFVRPLRLEVDTRCVEDDGESTVNDIRYGLRVLRRNPLFTATAALSLAIGIGATIAVFTIASGLLLRSAVSATPTLHPDFLFCSQRGPWCRQRLRYCHSQYATSPSGVCRWPVR